MMTDEQMEKGLKIFEHSRKRQWKLKEKRIQKLQYPLAPLPARMQEKGQAIRSLVGNRRFYMEQKSKFDKVVQWASLVIAFGAMIGCGLPLGDRHHCWFC